jgi:hypothetical protein
MAPFCVGRNGDRIERRGDREGSLDLRHWRL